MTNYKVFKRALAFVSFGAAAVAGAATAFVLGSCGPFTDVSPVLCPYVLEMYYLGLTVGTSPTTYSPNNPVTRGQAAVFVAKGLNQAIARSSRRAALGQWWNGSVGPFVGIGVTDLGQQGTVGPVVCDGTDVWVIGENGAVVDRVRGSDGRLLETWTSAEIPRRALVAMGRIYVGAQSLARIDPSKPAGEAVVVATIPNNSSTHALAFDGSRIWWGAYDGTYSLFIYDPSTGMAPAVSSSDVYGLVRSLAYDGSNVWAATDVGLLKLDAAGSVLQTVPVTVRQTGSIAFDGANLWVPSGTDSSVAVVSVASGSVVATVTGNGISNPNAAVFDGERVLILSDGVASLFRAADLTPLGNRQAGVNDWACSDGLNFWVALDLTGQLGRY